MKLIDSIIHMEIQRTRNSQSDLGNKRKQSKI